MEIKSLTIPQITGVIAFISLIIGTFLAIDNRYASADAFSTHVVFSEIDSLESRLDRLTDKLGALMAKPPNQRQAWEREEIERLKSEIQKIRAKIRRLG